ncbi:unnamed protein product [Miscanthus lutarioriparius]|uniref:Retrotransposon gag domain-containing protein n=1 Tax=Miscanthus lutarioriparius TaxID=422564 RepID=A0A811R2L3_9POAL|nr:unnamed protein product [Miscanthus lutarioriparius]
MEKGVANSAHARSGTRRWRSASTSWRRRWELRRLRPLWTPSKSRRRRSALPPSTPASLRWGKICNTQSHAAVLFDICAQDFEQRIAEAELRMGDLELLRIYELQDERDERVSALESAASVLEEWRPFVEGTLDDVCLEVPRLKQKFNSCSQPCVPMSRPPDPPPPLPLSHYYRPSNHPPDPPPPPIPPHTFYCSPHPAYTYPTPSIPPPIHQQFVASPPYPNPITSLPPHHSQFSAPVPHSSQIQPITTTLLLHPNQIQPITTQAQLYPNYMHLPTFPTYPTQAPLPHDFNLGHLPKTNSPQFDGDNPQLWITRAQNYFEMYSVPHQVWIRVATHHFISAAARWLQSVECNLPHDWQTFCHMIHQCFSRDQHKLLIRQLYHIKQITSVQDYIERFTELVEQLSAYATPDPLYYTTCFIDGLRHDIRSIVMVQCPCDLDFACTLALLQEEALEPGHRRDFKKSDTSIFSKTANIKGALPLPPPLPRAHVATDEKKGAHAVPGSSTDDKLSALRSYRKARGLCIRRLTDSTCEQLTEEEGHLNLLLSVAASTGQPSRPCVRTGRLVGYAFGVEINGTQATNVIFNFMCCKKFLISAMRIARRLTDSTCERLTEEEGHLNLLLSVAASTGQPSSCTLQFLGTLGGLTVHILIDSGSNHSFLSSTVAAQLQGVTPTTRPVIVKVANGGSMQCSEEIPSAEWSVQGYTFHSNLKIVPLSSFDMIVGMDWLEAFSPMKIHWLQRWISLPYGCSTAVLHGICHLPLKTVSCCSYSWWPQTHHLIGQRQYILTYSLCSSSSNICLPSPQNYLLAENVTTKYLWFLEQVLYQSGSTRYSPVLKSGIETQVSDMLQTGFIHPSKPSPLLF